MAAQVHEWSSGDSYMAIEGRTVVDGITFANWGMACGKRTFAVANNERQPDASHPMSISNAQITGSDTDSQFHLANPNPKVCVKCSFARVCHHLTMTNQTPCCSGLHWMTAWTWTAMVRSTLSSKTPMARCWADLEGKR